MLDEDEEDFDPDYSGETKWVIPHRSSLDYCSVRVLTAPDAHGRVFVEGYRSHGWTVDHARIKTRVQAKKLTDIPSWRNDFKNLYDDPCQPERRPL